MKAVVSNLRHVVPFIRAFFVIAGVVAVFHTWIIKGEPLGWLDLLVAWSVGDYMSEMIVVRAMKRDAREAYRRGLTEGMDLISEYHLDRFRADLEAFHELGMLRGDDDLVKRWGRLSSEKYAAREKKKREETN